jgi:hypothetical protein
MNDKMRPAVIGGVILGLLTAIPFIGAVNYCCCAWAILGGLLATHFYVKSSPTPVRPGDGAIVGAIAGVIGAVIYVVVGVPLGVITGNATVALVVSMLSSLNPDAAAQMQAQYEAMQGMSTGSMILASIPGALIMGLLIIVFATVGGLLGVPIFEKRKGGATPPPPPAGGGFGGATGGGYGQGS